MAKKEKTTAPKTASAKQFTGQEPGGQGWVDVKPAESRVWFVVGQGNSIQGKLLGRRQMKKRNRDGSFQAFYQVELTEPCDTCITGKGEEAEEVSAQVGDVVNVGERYELQDWKQYAEDKRTIYEVYAQALGQEQVGDGNEMWRFLLRARPIGEKETADR